MFWCCDLITLLFQGALFHYTVLQTVLIWFIHVASVFHMIAFPLPARNLQKSLKYKIIHITTVLVVLTLPVETVIAIATTGGFIFPSFPPQLCVGLNPDAVFYSFILPITVISQVGTTLLLLLFYNIHMVSCTMIAITLVPVEYWCALCCGHCIASIGYKASNAACWSKQFYPLAWEGSSHSYKESYAIATTEDRYLITNFELSDSYLYVPAETWPFPS